MKKMSLLLVVILLLNILSFNVFAGDIEHLKWFYSIDDVVYEPKGSGVIKINDSIMVSINEFCGLLGYVISEGNGKVTITEGKPCINNEGKIKQIDFEVGKNIIKLTEKSGKIQYLESLTDVSITYGYENEIYVSADDLQRIFDLKFDRSSYDKNEIIIYTQNYLSDIANNIKTFDELTNLSQKNIAEISIRKQADEVIITSPLIISAIADTVKNLQLRQNYDSGAGGWLYWVKFKTDTGEIIEYTVSTGEKIDGIQYRAIDDTEVRKCLEHYYNLYKSINSSEWATDIIAEAVNLGIINEDNSWNFPSSICREDFCNIAVRMIESAGVILPTENPQRPLGIKDTDNINVLKLYKSGVILGKEHHKTGITFAPNDFITREEAATILYRMAKVMGIGLGVMRPEVVYYWDEDKASDWALDAIKYMRNIRVMDGVNGYEFYPKDTYTVEQAIATMIRLFEKKANQYDDSELISEPEQLTMADVNRLQNLVNEGHMSWRAVPELVVKAFLGYKTNKDAENGKIVELAGGSERCSVKFELDGTTYNLELVRPIDKTDNGVWVVETFENEAEKEIFFHEASLEKTPVEKQDDGWYKFPEKVVAEFPFPSFHYEKPISVTAIFTPTGTKMDKMAKEIAKIEPPYMYQSMAEVLNMKIDFSKIYERGHLQFIFNMKDGSSEKSEIFNVYIDRTNKYIEQFYLHKINPDTNRLDGEGYPQENGWYKVYPKTMLSAYVVELALKEVIVYFTPYGETAEKEIGRTNTFEQAPFSVEINFSPEDKKGYLYFEIIHEYGTEFSPTYFVYQD